MDLTAPPPTPASAADAVKMPESGKPSASRARDALKSLPFTMDAPSSSESSKKSDRPGARAGANARSGHKQTKAELEEEVRRLRSERAALAGEQEPELAATEARLRPALEGTLGAAFSFVASIRGAHWELADSDGKKLADVWAPVLAPYMSDTAEALPWIVALGVTYKVVEKKVRIDTQLHGGKRQIAAAVIEEESPPAPSSPPASRPIVGELPLDPPARDPYAPGPSL